MKRLSILLFLLVLVLGVVIASLAHPGMARALPEYSAQTGEPCATCHLSPSGGGPRGPRGQAWVGGGKPGSVLSLVESLDFLGIKIESDPADFLPSGQPVQPAQPLQTSVEASEQIHSWLRDYDGN